jgi:putative nucleotidyltransferase with HDIG domain
VAVSGEQLLGRLSEAQRRAVARLGGAFARQGASLALVGGAVRDLLLERAVPDLDFTTDAEPATIRAAGQAAGATAIYSANERFATVGLELEGETIEITTHRGEPGGGLRADLVGRDFTCNAMAIVITGAEAGSGALVDPFDGQGDLVRRTIRGVADPAARLADDPLRALRAIRFAAEFEALIEPETRAAIVAHRDGLTRISRERIGAALTLLLLTPDVAGALLQLERLGLVEYVLPELLPLIQFQAAGSKDLWTHTRLVVAATPARPVVRWAALLHDAAKPHTYSAQGGEVHFFGHELAGARIARGLLSRLKIERELVQAVALLVELWPPESLRPRLD